MHCKESLIFDIKGNSLEDGPGIRTVLFFKGCPLDCIWCHNPEGKSFKSELLFQNENCIKCKECVKVCETGAIELGEVININREKCIKCFKCSEVCPSISLKKCGENVKQNDIIKKVVKYKDFYIESDGGVTLSGGEPLQHVKKLSSLVKELKNKEINILIETSGYFDMDEVEINILPYVDTIYYDIKLINQNDHQKFCGTDNSKILNNFIKLKQLVEKYHIMLLPRTPLIPNITDTAKNIDNIIKFYNKHNISTASLLPNNPIWFDKNEQLNLENRLIGNQEVKEFYNMDKFKKLIKLFNQNRIEII